MSLLAPLALALSAVCIPIILMYILKLRRRPQVVSSTLLWQRALDDLQANAPWQRLRPSVLLLLQLLAVLALVLALAGPAYTSSHRFSGDLILIVDQSYGMQAHDVSPSRFAAALARAHGLAGDLPTGNVASVIGMGKQPTVAIAESSDTGAVDRAIDGLQAGVASPNFLGALSLAASLARNGEATRAVVLTSRESGISSLPIHVNFPVQIVRIGGRLRDLGITAFSASRSGSHVRALARIANFGTSKSASDLRLSVDGRLADVRPLSVGAGKQQTEFWSDLPASARSLHLTLTHGDDVTTDKQAWAVAASGSTRHVLLVAKADYFLQTALSLDPSVELSTVTPSGYRSSFAPHYDLVVFDGLLPATLPAGSALILSPPAGQAGPFAFGRYSLGGTASASPAPPASLASLLKYVDLSDVHVAQTRAVSLPGWMQPIATAGGSPILAAGQNGNRRLAVTTFNMQDSDWPLRISFPIAMQNLLHYLVPGLELNSADIAAGQPVQFAPSPGVSEIDITGPNGVSARLRPPFPPFAGTEAPGLYTATTSGGFRRSTVTFAVNFFPSRPAPAVGPSQILLGHVRKGSSHSVGSPVSVAWAVALGALALLTAEWWFAFRR